MRPLFIAIFAMALLTSGNSVSQGLDSLIRAKDEELKRLREEIAEERKKILELEKREKDTSQLLGKLEREERLVKKLISSLSEKEAMLERQVGSLREDLRQSEMAYRSRLETLARRVRELYKESSQASWQRLLGARNFDDLINRYRYLSAIAEQDAKLVQEIKRRKGDIEKSEANITETLAQVSSSKREKESELAKLRENERRRQRSLADLRASKSRVEKRLADLAQAERDILSIIEDLEQRRATMSRAEEAEYAERDFPALKGRMAFPVSGSIVRGFGSYKHPELGTVTNNKGVDIEAKSDAPVIAVARGKVEFAGSLPGLGNCIILAHGAGYYTLYAHVAKMFVRSGQTVNAGEKIAEVGAASEESREVHFEIRKGKTPLDPSAWLRK